jgi:hypothetical protein
MDHSAVEPFLERVRLMGRNSPLKLNPDVSDKRTDHLLSQPDISCANDTPEFWQLTKKKNRRMVLPFHAGKLGSCASFRDVPFTF